MDKFTDIIGRDGNIDYNLIKYKLFDKISPLKSWLFTSTGLNMMRIVNRAFDSYKSPLTKLQIDSFNQGLELLRKTSMAPYIDDKLRQKLPGGISAQKLVLNSNGEYSYLNKLNTNFTGLAELLADLIVKGIKNDYGKGILVYEAMMEDAKTTLLKLKPHLERLLSKYYPTLEDYLPFEKYPMQTSKIGEDAEEMAMNTLQKYRFDIVYQGGNGDFIDMIFGCDIIVYRQDYEYKTVQVKVKMLDWSKIAYYNIDWLGVGYYNTTFYDMATKKQINLSGYTG